MENKQTAPKEIWVTSRYEHTNGKYFGSWQSVVKVSVSTDIKYIHSSEVERLLAEKDEEIEDLKTKLQIRENLNRNANREDI